jgi:type II secretory pathway pseudopilin PulG
VKKQSGFTLIELLTVVFGLVALALAGAALWVAIHFIAKFW